MKCPASLVCMITGVLALAAAEPANLLRNGSFEAGWCHEIGRMTLYDDAEVPDATWLTTQDAFDGKIALRLPKLARNRYFTLPVSLKPGQLYTLSLRAKALGKPSRVSLVASHPATRPKLAVESHPIKGGTTTADITTGEWTKVAVEVAGGTLPIFLEFSGSDMLIDAIQFLPKQAKSNDDFDLSLEEPGNSARTYIPAAAIACGIHDPAIGRIHLADEPVTLPVQCYNHGADSLTGILHYSLRNQTAAIVAEGKLEIGTIQPQAAQTGQLNLGNLPHGKYALSYWLDGMQAAGGVLTFDVIPPLPAGRIAPIGLLTDLSPPMIALMQRAGLTYYASLVDHAVHMNNRYDFDTRTVPDHSAIFRQAEAAGLIMSNHIMPSQWERKAPWTQAAWLPARHPDPGPDADTYYDAVEKYVQIYARHFKVWWICDEAEGHYHPHQLLPVLERTRAIILKHRPDAEIMVSATAPWWDQFARIGGMDLVDWFGGSVMGMSGDHGRKLNHLSRTYKKKVWPTAGAFTRESQFSPGHGGQIHANWRLHHALITSLFLHRATASSMYRAMPGAYDWTMVHDPFNVLAPDNTMSSALALYTIAGRFLAGIVPAESHLSASDKIWPYTTANGTPGLCLFPGAPPLTLDLPAERVQHYDQLGNPTTQPPSADAFAFIQVAGITEEELRAAVRVEQSPPTLVVGPIPVADGESVAIQNPDGTRIAPPHPYSERFPWAGLQTDSGPLWLHTARRLQAPPVIDGDTAEWQRLSASSLYYSLWTLAALDQGPIHGEQNTHLISCDNGMDFRVDWSACYDDNQLYLRFQVLDDYIMAGDKLVIKLGDTRTVTIHPTGNAVTVFVDDIAVTCPVARRLLDDEAWRQTWQPWTHPSDAAGYTLEIALPWQFLGMKPQPGTILGFDVLGHDTDPPGETSVLRWAGKAPRGYLRLGVTPFSLEPQP